MKIKSIRRILVLILILTSLVFFFPWGGHPTVPGARASNLQPPHPLEGESPRSSQNAIGYALPQQYAEHEPIKITKNADFVTFGFPGEGSPSNPYVIESLNISGIGIKNTTAYFLIRNNYVEHIGLANVIHGTIDSNIVTNDGISLGVGSEQNTVSNNIISYCYCHSKNCPIHAGIKLYLARSNTISGNTISNCMSGIYLENSEQNTVSHNIITDIYYAGILLWDSPQNTLAHNTVSTSYVFAPAIQLRFSEQNTLVGNRLVDNGLHILGNQIKDYYQATVADNLVNGRPLVFWQNVRGGSVPPGAGQIFLLNCTGVEVTGQDLAQAFYGVDVVFCSNLTIHHNIVSKNDGGIGLSESGQITVAHNTVSYNHGYGIFLYESKGCTLFNNTVSYNYWGIDLGYGGHNTVSNNTISYNDGYGIYLSVVSEDNMVTGNNFLGNRLGGYSQARDEGHGNVFVFNYWDDHDNTDRNGDGIADTPYFIEGDAGNQDKAPLALPANLNRHLLLIPTILYPNGGETLQGRGIIDWVGVFDSLGHSVTYTVAYSPDNGSTWIPLASGLSTTRYLWNITTVTNGTAYRVKVVATCSEGLTAEDCSDAPFTIRHIAHSISTPTILFPNGGETLQGTVILHWTPTNDSWEHSVTYAILYSLDNGRNWTPLASGLSTATYEWDTTTVVKGSKYRIRVIATCSEGLTAEDRSDAPFTIQNLAATTTVGAFPTLGGPVGMLLATLLLASILVGRLKRKSR